MYYLGVIGLLLFIFVQYDFCMTTLATAHSGPISVRLIYALKAGSLMVNRYVFHNRLFLSAFGGLTTLCLLALWIGLTWFSWLLIFYSTSNAVVSSSDGTDADISERIYFVGYLITTLGMGDFVPNTAFFRIMAALASFWGFLQFGLIAAWLLNVSQAVAAARTLATQIAAAGHNPAELLANCWDGDSFGSLDSFLSSISAGLATRAQQEIFMPVLSNFHPYEREAAEVVQIAVIDETLTLLLYAIEDVYSKGINKFTLLQARNIITILLNRATEHPPMGPTERPPPIHDISKLQLVDIPIIEDEEYRYRMHLPEVMMRRRMLQGFVHTGGYTWKEVWRREEEHKPRLRRLIEQFPFLTKRRVTAREEGAQPQP